MLARRRPLRTLVATLVAALVATPDAHAVLCGTILDPISVSATPVSFATYDPLRSTATQASGTVRITCGLPVDLLPSFVVRLSRGQSATYTPRTLRSGASTLAYNLYTSAALGTVWGDGTGGTSARSVSGTLQVGSINLTAFGAITQGQLVGAGTYTDMITVTVQY